MMRYAWLAVVLIFEITGCAPHPDPTAQFTQCMDNAYNEPVLQPVTRHFPIPSNNLQPTLTQLEDDSKPSKKDVHLLAQYQNAIIVCRQNLAAYVSRTSPELMAALSQSWVQNDQVMLDLSKRKISWGEAVKRKQEIAVSLQQQLVSAYQSAATLQAAQRQAAAAQRQANAANLSAQASMQQANRPAPVSLPMYHPTTTNCNMIGSTLNCNTY